MSGLFQRLVSRLNIYSGREGRAATQYNSGRNTASSPKLEKVGWVEYIWRTIPSSVGAAIFFAQLAEKYHAFAELDKAVENREYTVRFLKVEPGFDPLRDDSRFKALLVRMRFPE